MIEGRRFLRHLRRPIPQFNLQCRQFILSRSLTIHFVIVGILQGSILAQDFIITGLLRRVALGLDHHRLGALSRDSGGMV